MFKKSMKIICISLIILFIFSTVAFAETFKKYDTYDKIKNAYDSRNSLSFPDLSYLTTDAYTYKISNLGTQEKRKQVGEWYQEINVLRLEKMKKFIPKEADEFLFVYEESMMNNYRIDVILDGCTNLSIMSAFSDKYKNAQKAYENWVISFLSLFDSNKLDDVMWFYENKDRKIFEDENKNKRYVTDRGVDDALIVLKKALLDNNYQGYTKERIQNAYDYFYKMFEERGLTASSELQALFDNEAEEQRKEQGNFSSYALEFRDRGSNINLGGASSFTAKVGSVLGFIRNIGAIVSVIAISIIGVKYMIGSVEEKAEYKKNLIPFVFGLVFFTGIVTIVTFILRVTNNMAQ